MLRNIIATLIGIVVCLLVNSSLISISGSMIPLPEGMDINNFENYIENVHLLQPKHYIMPFLAHALGTLVGVIVAMLIAKSHFKQIAMIISIFHLIGGIAAVYMIPAPVWFNILDLTTAYIPMGILGTKLMKK